VEAGEKDHQVVIERLERTYGETDEETPFEMRLVELGSRIAEDYYGEVMQDVREYSIDSRIESLDDEDLASCVLEILKASICFMLLQRCSFNPDRWDNVLDFSHIGDFNSLKVLNIIGSAVSNLTRPVLMEIRREVEQQNKDLVQEKLKKEKNKVLDFVERSKKIKLEKEASWDYNALKHESEEKRNDEKQAGEAAERGEEDDTGVRTGQGLPDSEPEGKRGAGRDADEVRTYEEKISEGKQGRSVWGDALRGLVEAAPADRAGTGREPSGLFDGADGKERRSGRDTESNGATDLGGTDEQHQGQGGGDSLKRDSLRLNKEEQDEKISEADSERSLSASSMPENDFLTPGDDQTELKQGEYQQISFFDRDYIEENKAQKVISSSEPDTKKQTESKVTIQDSRNFRITDDNLGTGGKKEKFRTNIEAIKTLQRIESEKRTATPVEQETLSKYVGWGGLAEAFEENRSGWEAEYRELKGVLTEEEYVSARESTLNAHYTSPLIIRSIYETLDRMGFKAGNILEPAMGIGNFFGMLPESMRESKLYGVELDSITGRIAKLLYPDADIQIKGFEQTDFQRDFFDLAVGNVPFGDYRVSDRGYDRFGFSIHDYFFAKSLEKVRSGGIVAFVTSRWTLDKKDETVRKYISQRAEFLGAVRLPNTAFKANAGTETTTDIIFLKKRDRIMEVDEEWLHVSADEEGRQFNEHYRSHPKMVAGTLEMVSGPHGQELTCKENRNESLEVSLRSALGHIEGSYEEAEIEEEEDEGTVEMIPANSGVQNYSYCIIDDKVYYRENSVMKRVTEPGSIIERLKGMIDIRDGTQKLIEIQLEDYSDEEIKRSQTKLNTAYDNFVKKYGLLSSRTNKRAMGQDAGYCLLCSLEKFDDDGKYCGKADMFSRRTIKKAEVVTEVDTASEALAVSLCEKAKVDLPYMSELSKKPEKEIIKELQGVIFKDPLTAKWETADEYLSGNVRDKLKIARSYAETHPQYTINVQSLERVQPKELDASEIEIRLGATWVEPGYIEDFMREVFQTPEYLFDRKTVGIQFTAQCQ